MSKSPTPDDDIALLLAALSKVTELLQKIVDTPNESYLSDWELGYEDGQRALARRILAKLDI